MKPFSLCAPLKELRFGDRITAALRLTATSPFTTVYSYIMKQTSVVSRTFSGAARFRAAVGKENELGMESTSQSLNGSALWHSVGNPSLSPHPEGVGLGPPVFMARVCIVLKTCAEK